MVDTSSFYTAATSDIASIPTEWLIILIILLVWKFIWYGIALFKTIERKQITWFTVLFIATFLLGDLGLLAIIYLLLYKEKSKPAKKKARLKKKRR